MLTLTVNKKCLVAFLKTFCPRLLIPTIFKQPNMAQKKDIAFLFVILGELLC